jgi:DNA-directed RNA polymerase specialized sigma24 family protein
LAGEEMNKTFAEIAKAIGISETTAHRVHCEAVIKLREKLALEPEIIEWLKTTRKAKNECG